MKNECDICGKKLGKLFKKVIISGNISKRDDRMGSWESDKEIIGHPDCIENINFREYKRREKEPVIRSRVFFKENPKEKEPVLR